jgi:HSP20 family molecular chaperone IbpA
LKGAKSEEFWSPVVVEAMNHGIELDERGDELIARAVLSGLRKSDFNVEVTNERLVIRGSKSRSSKKQSRGYSRVPREFRCFRPGRCASL